MRTQDAMWRGSGRSTSTTSAADDQALRALGDLTTTTAAACAGLDRVDERLLGDLAANVAGSIVAISSLVWDAIAARAVSLRSSCQPVEPEVDGELARRVRPDRPLVGHVDAHSSYVAPKRARCSAV